MWNTDNRFITNFYLLVTYEKSYFEIDLLLHPIAHIGI